MTQVEVLHAIVRELRYRGVVSKQKDIADKLGIATSNLSSAMHGSNVLTIGLLRRINEAYGNMFSDKWIETGDGEMYACNVHVGTDVNLDLSHHNASGGSTVIDGSGEESAVLQIALLKAEIAGLKRELEWAKKDCERLAQEKAKLEQKNDDLQESLLEAIKAKIK